MVINFPWITKQKPEIFLVLDIGTEAVKALVFQKKNNKFIILKTSLEYFDGFGMLDASVFKIDVIKKAILRILQNLKRGDEKLPENVLLTFPPLIFKARIVFHSSIRKNPKETINEKEKKKILQQVLKEIKQEISQEFSRKFGSLPEDIHFVDLKVLERKIDGYEVPVLAGYKGKKLDFRVLATFLSKYWLKPLENIIQTAGFKDIKVVHKAEGLNSFLEFSHKSDGIFLDIGGETTQIFLVKAGKLAKIDEIEIGGKSFSQAISERLGLTEQRSRILKEKYSEKMLSKGSSERIKEILWPEVQNLFSDLDKKLLNQKISISKNVFLFGGGSQLPEIKEILKKHGFIPEYLEVVKTTGLPEKILNNPQHFSSFLICYTV